MRKKFSLYSKSSVSMSANINLFRKEFFFSFSSPTLLSLVGSQLSPEEKKKTDPSFRVRPSPSFFFLCVHTQDVCTQLPGLRQCVCLSVCPSVGVAWMKEFPLSFVRTKISFFIRWPCGVWGELYPLLTDCKNRRHGWIFQHNQFSVTFSSYMVSQFQSGVILFFINIPWKLSSLYNFQLSEFQEHYDPNKIWSIS